MTRRNSFLFGLAALTIVSAAAYFTRSQPSYATDIGEMRACLEADTQALRPSEPIAGGPIQIQLNIQVVALNRNQVGMPLLESDAAGPIKGKVKNTTRLFNAAQRIPGTNILMQPVLTTMNGQAFSTSTGSQFPLFVADGAVIMKQCGVHTHGKATLGKDGRIHMDFDMTLIEPKVANPTTDADFDIMDAKTALNLADGEIAFVGGVTRKCVQSKIVAVPVLSGLPGIGTWFQFTQQAEVEQELLILITPKVIRGLP